jgi:hypothetical protein
MPEVWNWFAGFSSRFHAEIDSDFGDIEMAGTVPPEDNNLCIAADGTGDFYSIQLGGGNGIRERRILWIQRTTRSLIRLGREHILRSAIRIRIFLLRTRPGNMSLRFFYAVRMGGTRRKRPRSRAGLPEQ